MAASRTKYSWLTELGKNPDRKNNVKRIPGTGAPFSGGVRKVATPGWL